MKVPGPPSKEMRTLILAMAFAMFGWVAIALMAKQLIVHPSVAPASAMREATSCSRCVTVVGYFAGTSGSATVGNVTVTVGGMPAEVLEVTPSTVTFVLPEGGGL